MKTQKMTIAKFISQVTDYSQCLHLADAQAVDSDQDYATETTTFTFEDESKLALSSIDYSITVL